ncbi:hypothetical protein RHGRI_009285 [Rhododendron griersonianum]|uniref:Uncharacterized protein n=1 Tax=Rhododendron griersonianum TaxID=479676 RepID=A0AAV6L481_9ERIC|nr:hypothetical protein RHGRI_009285 [Rhododendron griersonianum]
MAPLPGKDFLVRWLLGTFGVVQDTFGFCCNKMVEIHNGERPPQAVGGEGVTGLDNPTPSKPRSKRPFEREYSTGATLLDEIPAVLRSDPQVREYLRQLNDRMAKKDRMFNALRKDVHMLATAIRLWTPSPSRDRYWSPSPRRAEGRGIHVKERLGKRVTPSDERAPSQSSDQSQARGDVRDRLGSLRTILGMRSRRRAPVHSTTLAYTASHETAVDRQREHRYREDD